MHPAETDKGKTLSPKRKQVHELVPDRNVTYGTAEPAPFFISKDHSYV